MEANKFIRGNLIDYNGQVIKFKNAIGKLLNVEIHDISGDIINHEWLENAKPIITSKRRTRKTWFRCY